MHRFSELLDIGNTCILTSAVLDHTVEKIPNVDNITTGVDGMKVVDDRKSQKKEKKDPKRHRNEKCKGIYSCDLPFEKRLKPGSVRLPTEYRISWIIISFKLQGKSGIKRLCQQS